jgi:hypothetical protein
MYMYYHGAMAFTISFNEEKDELLKATRGIGFDEVIRHLKSGDLLADKENPSQSRSNQRIYVVRIGEYAYAVPYVINDHKQEIFLKTVYPTRAYTKLYIKGGRQDAK